MTSTPNAPSAAQATHLGLELSSHRPATHNVADRITLAIRADPPPWVDGWTSTLDITYVPTPRSKARGSATTNPSHDRARRELAKPRPGQVVSSGMHYLPASDGDRRTFIDVLWTTHFRFTINAFDIGPAALGDTALSLWLLNTVADVLALAPPCRPAAAWFGAYARHPYCFAPVGDDQLPGYGWLVTMPTAVVDRLGGPAAAARSPAALHRTVATPDGDTVTVLVLTETVAAATHDHLRRWKQFLTPVLDTDRHDDRAAAFAASAHTHPWQYDVPPLVLPEDWPTPPTPEDE